MLPSPISEGDLHCHAPGSRQRKSRRVGTPGLSQRLSSKSMAISETPILCHIITTHLYSRIYAIRPRTGVAENRQNVRNPPPLSSAPFCIRLVIRDFSKTAEDRSSADTGVPPRRPRHLRHPAPVHLRNVRAYILFDCPMGIFADNHIKLLETWSRMRRL